MERNTLKLEKKGEYIIVQLNRGKANVLNHEMVQEIRQTFDDLISDNSVRGVVLSGQPNFYSAGLDVIELFDYDREKMSAFFLDFMGMLQDLVKFPKPMIAAITGHSPAGGCILAIACDYRIMAKGEKFTIGLNEVAVNILISHIIYSAYSFWIGPRRAHQYLLEGKLLPVQEALEVGLIDEAVELEHVVPRAEQYLKKILMANQDILEGTKAAVRKELIAQMEMDLPKYVESNMALWWNDEIRGRMKFFVDSLKAKKKK